MNTEYLSRPLIEDVIYTIEADHVRIASPHTIFADERRLELLDKGALLALYGKVLSMAKAQNVKISYKRHTRKTIIERWAGYENAVQTAEKTFDSIVETAEIIRKRGIHRGCNDDQELNRLTAARNKYMEFRWRTNIVSQMLKIAGELRELDRELSKANHHLYMIHL